MNEDLKRLVHERLESEGLLTKNWSSLVLSACDGPEALEWPEDGPPPELGDVVICPDAAQEPLDTLAVHGVLHLLGWDHEVDDGEMLALQDQLVAEAP